MENTNIPLEEQNSGSPVKKKKGRLFLILFLLVALLAAGGAGTFYFYQRSLPQETMEVFLKDMQKMDLSGMASHLQSSDLSALNNADIRNEAFQEFFRGINEKMSWEITKNQFDIQNGTAQITVHVKYVDGSNIYRDAINEFLRQIVSAALSGQDISDTQAKMQENLASILTEKAKTAEPEFSETDITYPLIRENKVWKIVALDEETVKIMSANFKNATEEIQKTLIEDNTSATDDLSAAEGSEGEGSTDAEDSEGKASSAEAKSETAAENSNDKTTSADSDATNSEDKIVSSDSDAKDSNDKTASESSDDKTTSSDSNSKNSDGKTVSEDSDAKDSNDKTAPAASGKDLNLAGANFSLRYTHHRITEDFSGKPCLMFYYDYTNNGTTPSSAMVDINLQAFQDGQTLSGAISEKNDDAVDRFFQEVQPGETVNICQVFALNGEGDVTVQASGTSDSGEENSASQILSVN